MDQDKLIRNLRMQLRVERAIIVLVAIFLLARWGHDLLQERPYAILVDDKPVACLTNEQIANRVLTDIKGAVDGVEPSEVSFKERVVVRRAPRGTNPQTESEATKAVLETISLRVDKYSILVEGVPAVALDSPEDANSVLESAKEMFGSRVANLMEEPSFKEQVDVQSMTVDLSLYRKYREAALDCLLRGGAVSQSGTYMVKEGDVAGAIATKFRMKLSELEALNPNRNLNKLRIGDELKVGEQKPAAGSAPKLTVVVRNQSKRTEVIPFQTETVSSVRMVSGKQVELSPGRNGLRTVTVADTFENGVKKGSEVLEEIITREPVPRRVAIGIGIR